MAKKILFVDDEVELAFMISDCLRLYGYDVLTADGPDNAVEVSRDVILDVIILDVNLADLAGKDGVNLMGQLKRNHPLVPIILYTGMGKGDEEVKDMMKQGVYKLVSKADSLEVLIKAVQGAGQAGFSAAKK